LLVVLKRRVHSRWAQAVGAAGVGNVERSSALFTTILRQGPRLLLQKKPMMQNVVSLSKALIKKTIAQVVIIVIVILGSRSKN